MGVSEERVDLEVNLRVAQALVRLKELNASAASLPAVVQNVNAAMDKMVVETGLGLGAIETKFKTLGIAAENYQKILAANPLQILAPRSPMENALLRGGQPFGEIGAQAGYKAAADQRKEGVVLSKLEAKSQAEIAAGQNKQVATQNKLLDKEKKRLALLSQEQLAIEKQGVGLNKQIGLYGQVAKTSSEMMASLRSFSGTQKGQGILTNFFGDYKQASGVTQQIGAIKTAVTDLSKATGASFSQSGQIIKEQFSQIPGVVNQTNQAVRQLGSTFEDTSSKTSKLGSHLKSLATTFLAFAAVAAIIKVFGEATKAARELEVSLFRLSNAERILSESGSDVSMEGFKDGIAEIKKLFPIFSEEDITQLIAQLSIATKDFGLSQKQIIELAKNAAVLNIRSTEEETVSQTAAKLATALSVKGKGIGSLNVSFSKTTLEAKALELGILNVGESLTGLSDKDMALVKIEVISDNANKEMEKMGDYMDTNDAKIRKNAASWHDLLTSAGALLNTLVPVLDPIIQFLDYAVTGAKILFFLLQSGFEALFIYTKNLGRRSWQEIFDEVADQNFDSLFPTMPNNTNPNSSFARMWEKYAETVETATIANDSMQESLDSIDTEKAQDELKDMLKDLENLQEEMGEKEADYQVDLGRFDEDAATDSSRAIEDYNLNVTQANRDAKLAQKEANEKYRQKELEDERKYQEDMRKLQEDFLYSLEDALRERDARQVLRLIDKYNMDKTAMENENALRKTAAAENKALEDAERKAQLDEKLRVMAEEQTLKMQRMNEDSALKRERMEADHALEMSRLKEQLDERIQQAAEKMAEELGLNAEGAKAIYDLLAEYYGTDGALAALTEGGYAAMLGNASGFLTALTGVIAQYSANMAAAVSSASNAMSQLSYGQGMAAMGQNIANYNAPPDELINPNDQYAKGGQFITTRPRKILVGEAGRELVQITPMSQIANGINGQNGANGISGLGGQSGQTQISVMVDLSPDLEARVVNRSLDGMSDVISKVRRGKQ